VRVGLGIFTLLWTAWLVPRADEIPPNNRFGSTDVPGFIEALKNRNERVRCRTTALLAQVWPRQEARAAIPALVRALSDNSPCVRGGALKTLALIDPNNRQIIPALIKGIKEKNTHIDVAEITELAGPQAKTAVRPLIKLLGSNDTDVLWKAARSLGVIGPAAKDSVLHLIPLLKNRDWYVRLDAAHALERIGPDAKEATSALIQALDDSRPDVQDGAAAALKKIGTPEAINAIREFDKKRNPKLQQLLQMGTSLQSLEGGTTSQSSAPAVPSRPPASK